jgi:hypothetical protein
MERADAEIEDLPPLELRKLRDLTLDEPSTPGRPSHLSSASGIVRRGDFVYVIGDDELFLGIFNLSTPDPGRLRRALEGDLPGEAAERKQEKPDLEALTLLPPFKGHPYGALLGLGSGSSPVRQRGFSWALGADGSLDGEPRAIELEPLYDRLREQIDELNIEGCSVVGERLWLLHRGNRGGTPNVVAELSLEALMTSLQNEGTLAADELEAMRSYDLGELDGAKLAFSDVAPLANELVVFTASAETNPGGDEDGEIRGSVVGTLGSDGGVQRLRAIDRRWKVEGVHASIDTGVVDLLFVCDQDDPDTPSPLLSAAMPLDAAFERG